MDGKLRMKKFGSRVGLMAAGLLMTAALSGCAEGTDPGNKRIIVEQETPAADYELVPVTRGDIVLRKEVNCTYSQFHSETLAFSVSGRVISKVYFRDGEVVNKGDLLAELSGGDREDEIERLEYQIAKNKLYLAQIDDTENYEISRRWLNKIYRQGYDQTGDIENYMRENEYRREDYRDAISLDQQQLDKLKKEVRQGKLYAGLSGTVSLKKKNLEGSTTVKDEPIIEIKDNSECFFATSDLKYRDYVREGETYAFSVLSGAGSGKYQVTPYKMDQWEDQMFFSIVDGDENAVFESGNSGSLTVIIDSRTQVLTLPVNAVHSADEKWYVYVINEEGIRDVKWIEIGLQGNDVVEIVGGLEEGEKVIQK